MKHKTFNFWFFVVLLFLLGIMESAYTTTITISSDTANIYDTTLYSDSTTDNVGANLLNWVGQNQAGSKRRLLLQFNLSSIPSDAVISAVTVTLNMTRAAGGLSGNQVFYRVLNSWSQGTGLGRGNVAGGQGGQPVPGGASWAFRQNFSLPWTTPGGDFSSLTSALNNVGSTAGLKAWSGSGLVSDVQAWVNGSLPNNGWILIGDEGASGSARIYSASENLVNSPSLTVMYTETLGVNEWELFNR